MRVSAVVILLAFAVLIASLAGAEDEWHRVASVDGNVSVLFPVRIDQHHTLPEKTPAGPVVTEVQEYRGDGVVFSISESKVPAFALTVAGKKGIIGNAKKSVLREAEGREVSYEKEQIDDTKGWVLLYESDSEEEDYSGLAFFFVVNKTLYVVNSMMSNATAANIAAQQRLLHSIHAGRP
jgi:hypothetical protein